MTTRPIDSFVKYFNEVKPYHTKILEVVEQYKFSEEMIVSIVDRINFVETFSNAPLCSGTGFGLDFDDTFGFDSTSNCNLGNCNGGFGLIYNNSDILVDANVVAFNNSYSTLTLSGDYRFDAQYQIIDVTANTVKLNGNLVAKITPHSVFSISPKSTYPVVETTPNGFYIENDHQAQINAVTEFVVFGSTVNDNTYNVINAEFDLATNRTFITTISTDGALNSGALGTISVKSYSKNNDLYNIESVNFDGAFTTITLGNDGVIPLPDETVHGSIVLRTGLFPSRRVWLYNGISLDEGEVIDDGDVLDNMKEAQIINASYNNSTEETTISLALTVDYDLSAVLSVQLRGYSFGAGFDGFQECSIPKPENISAGFIEHLNIQIVSYP